MASDYFVVTHSDLEIGRIDIPLNISCASIDYKNSQGQAFKMKYNVGKSFKNFGKSSPKKRYTPYDIIDATGNFVGLLSACKEKGFFGIPYYLFNYYDDEYFIYEVGLGKEGIKLLVFLHENQVAIIEKSANVMNFKDIYNVSTLDEKYVDVLSMVCAYWDLFCFSNSGQFSKNFKQTTLIYTKNKKLLSKYDPNFVNSCNE